MKFVMRASGTASYAVIDLTPQLLAALDAKATFYGPELLDDRDIEHADAIEILEDGLATPLPPRANETDGTPSERMEVTGSDVAWFAEGCESHRLDATGLRRLL